MGKDKGLNSDGFEALIDYRKLYYSNLSVNKGNKKFLSCSSSTDIILINDFIKLYNDCHKELLKIRYAELFLKQIFLSKP